MDGMDMGTGWNDGDEEGQWMGMGEGWMRMDGDGPGDEKPKLANNSFNHFETDRTEVRGKR